MIDLYFCTIVAAAAAIVYGNTLFSDWVFDDVNIAQDPIVFNRAPGRTGKFSERSWRLTWDRFTGKRGLFTVHYRGLLFLSYDRDAGIHGLDSFGWHGTNIAIHAVNSVLIYAILRAFAGPFASVLGSLIFAAHPLSVTAVSPIAGRSSTLCAIFYFSGLAAVLAGWWWLAVPLVYLAWRCKEEAAMWPVVALVTLFLIR